MYFGSLSVFLYNFAAGYYMIFMLIAAILVAYFALLYIISRFTPKAAGNTTFFCADRQSPWQFVALGMIGVSLSGVSFVSVPGMVASNGFTYLQMCMGFFFGYLFIAHVLLPIYYKRRYISIYSFLHDRFGIYSYRTGSLFFLLSKLTGAAARLYVVCVILQYMVFDALSVPFTLNVVIVLSVIWLYTHRGGMRTILWTDVLQTVCMLLALLFILISLMHKLQLGVGDVWAAVEDAGLGRIFVMDDFYSKQNFFKQFLSGVFVTIAMTGLDQDTMQKNLTCRSLKEARKNMYCYGMAFLPVNFLFLLLGALLLIFLQQSGAQINAAGDTLLPAVVGSGLLGVAVKLFFVLGIVSAAFSSADSAVTSITTSFCVDILRIGRFSDGLARKMRMRVHVVVAVVFVAMVLLFRQLNGTSLLDVVYILVGYTYGPLLGMYAFGLFTKRVVRDSVVPCIAISSPLCCFIIVYLCKCCFDYSFGYELLLLNGAITFCGMLLFGGKKAV